uniref:Uncharacterized protein n=1 Tax=viral metagenome TaxID=1070528 RepID=A0A6M3LBZ2_9ZZZZ
MIFFQCDECSKKVGGVPEVKLNGITGTSGGILLPERFHEKHFCKPACFWNWARKYDPKMANKSLDQTATKPGQ